MGEHFSERGIILRTAAVRESDVIAAILTQKRGKLSALARGARKSRRRFMGGLDLFVAADFTFATGASDLLALEGLCNRREWGSFRSHLGKYALASLALEVTNTFAPEHDAEGSLLFAPLEHTLEALHSAEEPAFLFAQVTFFLLRALNLTGVHPLASDLALQPEARAWLEGMLEQEAAQQASTPPVGASALISLLNYAEGIIGNRLATRAAALSYLSHCAARERARSKHS